MPGNNDLADHIAALIIEAVSRLGGDSHSVFRDDVPEFLRVAFGLDVAPNLLQDALLRLEELGGVRRFSSTFAGDMYEISVSRSLRFFDGSAPHPSENTSHEYDLLYDRAHSDFAPLVAYNFGKRKWVDRVVAGLAIGQTPDVLFIAPEATQIAVPASDRIVTLNHNQQSEMVAATDVVISKLRTENSVGGDVGLRERFLAQLSAGKELLGSQSVRALLIYETLSRMLGTLIAKYKGQAIGEAAKKLLGLLIEHIFGK